MIGRVQRDLVALAAPLLAMALVAGCNGSSPRSLWREDFETLCDGSPCGWTQIAGPAGAVSWIETVPTEHGLEMRGAGVAVSRTTTGREVFVQDPVSSMLAHVVARCDSGAQLTLIVTVQNVAGGPPIDLSGSATLPTEWDGTRSHFMLFPTDATNRDAEFIDILGVVLHKEGSGVCEVDYISLADQGVGFAE